MKRSKTLLMGVVFPKIEKYLKDYFTSVNGQDDKDFDLLIINDGLKREKVLELCRHPVDVVDNDAGLGEVQLRVKGINYALAKNYEHVVFSDADDYFSINRIRLLKKALQTKDIAFNELTLVSQTGNILESKLFANGRLNSRIKDIDDELDHHVLGLGNSAVRVDSLKGFSAPEGVVIFDWWLFSVLLLNGATTAFVAQAESFYRQHDGNSAGMNAKLNDHRLNFGIKAKKAHYACMQEYCRAAGKSEYGDIYRRKWEQMAELEDAVSSKQKRAEYLEAVNANLTDIHRGWWSDIVSLERVKAYGSIL